MRALGPARPARPARPALRLAPAAIVAGLALSGCGGGAGTGSDPATSAPSSPTTVSSSPSSSPSASPSDSPSPTTTGSAPADAGATQVAIVSQSAAGGEVYPAATALSDDAAVQGFGAQFTTPRLTAKLTRVVARTDVPAGSTLYGAVVAVGCDVPAAVVVSTDDAGGVLVEPEPAKPSGVQCLVPVTSVALVLVAGG